LSKINAPIKAKTTLEWAKWRNTLLLVLGLLFLRTTYLIWLCPYELVADEAQYWEWSRRLALSYYSKGPGVAWLIAGGTRLMGDGAGALRLPAALASALAALALARLATDCSQGDQRAGFFAALIFILIPIYHGTAQFMTIDGPYILCWIAAAWAGWNAFQRQIQTRPSCLLWVALGVALGVGFLFKYTMLLLVPGLVGYGWWWRQRLGWSWTSVPGLLLAAAVFLTVISPVLIWNYQQDWPTVSHLLGRVHLPGGDLQPRQAWAYNPLWTLGYIASPLAFLGPLAVVLLWLSLRIGCREMRRANTALSGSLGFVCWCAAPILLFYLAISLGTSIELNWSVAGFTTLLVPMAQTAVAALTLSSPANARRCPKPLAALRSGMAASVSFKEPVGVSGNNDPARTVGTCVTAVGDQQSIVLYRYFARIWKWFVMVSVAVLLVMSFAYPSVVTRIPVIGSQLAVHRVAGHRQFARRIDETLQLLRQQTDQQPFVVADSYWQASLLAYYLQGQPAVYSAASRIGSRKSSYDYFPDTDLRDERLLGRPMVMVGAIPETWGKAFRFQRIEEVPGLPEVFVGLGYGGPLVEAH
jgi:4-amino-4-deoxy-L-arabinose transferase-like glycosyltransferase